MTKFKLLFALCFLFVGGDALAEESDSLEMLAKTLQVEYVVVENKSGKACLIEDPCYFVELNFSTPYDLASRDWKLYYSQLNKLLTADSDDLSIKQLNGNLKVIEPNKAFKGFSKNQKYTLKLQFQGDHLNEFKPMPNYYLVSGKGDVALVHSTVPVNESETGLEVMPHLKPFSDEKKHFKSRLNDKNEWARSDRLYEANSDTVEKTNHLEAAIIPTPQKVNLKKGRLDISKGLRFELRGLKVGALEAAIERLNYLGVHESKKGRLVRVEITKPNSLDESYDVTINKKGILISARSASGAFYGLQTIASLVTVGSSTLPHVTISDEPRYTFRGLHLDVSRNFRSKQFILDMLEQMAAYKLNKLHLHLADDEGWRVEIDGLPELTDVGGFRCHDLSEDACILPQFGSGPFRNSTANGFYSREDYINILEEATKRHIQVIPSFDMPGHSRAAVRAMDARYRKFMGKGKQDLATEYLLSDPNDKTEYRSIQGYTDNTINVCMESSYNFVEKVIDELVVLHRKAGHPLSKYHIGADETPGAWVESPLCKTLISEGGVTSVKALGSHFIERVSAMLDKKGIITAGWSDGLGHTNFESMPARVHSNVWERMKDNAAGVTHQHVNQGWDAVLSIPDATYFDMPHESDPKERGYDWAARQINSKKIYQFMPDNLPIHAEFWKNNMNEPLVISDKIPLEKGKGILGVQAQLWSETVRSDSQAEYMIFPRLIVLAERMWHKASWEVEYVPEVRTYSESSGFFSNAARAERDKQWSEFASVLGFKELRKLDIQEVEYRLPTVGAVIESGTLKANVIFPGLQIEYKQGKGEWETYLSPVKVGDGPVLVRAYSEGSARRGRAIYVNQVNGGVASN